MMRSLVAWGAAAALFGVFATGCGGSSGGGDSNADGGDPDGGVGGPSSFLVTVDGTQNSVTLAGCGFQPAQFAGVPAGTYTITLTASTLSKGGVSGPKPPPPSTDNYVIVHVPLPAGDPHEDHRFFMLNGIGANASITLPDTETIDVMFVDSDVDDNNGTGTVTLSNGMTATVDAVANTLAYDTKCNSMPAAQAVGTGTWRLTLVDSTLSSGNGAHDDFVLVRTPSEVPIKDDRYVILNGVGATHDFVPFNSQTVRLWYIGANAGTGVAHVSIVRQ